MKSITDATALAWRAPTAAASPWGRRHASLWSLLLEGWRESMDILARTGGRRPWGFFL